MPKLCCSYYVICLALRCSAEFGCSTSLFPLRSSVVKVLMLKRHSLVRLLSFILSAFALCLAIAFITHAQSGRQQPRPANPGPQPIPTPTPRLSLPTDAPPVMPPPSDDVVRVETDLTSIFFTAVDKERHFINTLKPQDIRVLEDGQPQQVFTFERETDLPLSLAILIDTSKSQENTLPEQKTAANAFLDSVVRPDKDLVAVISFMGDARLQQNLINNLDALRRAIERVKVELPPDDPDCEKRPTIDEDPRCWTGIWDAVWATTGEVLSHTSEHTRRAVILLTDGDDTSSRTKIAEAIDFAIKSNVVVYSIGIGDRKNYEIKEKPLRKLSESTGGRAFFPVTKEDLQAAFQQIQQELRSQYLVAYAPTNRARDGSYRRVAIEIVNPEMKKQKLRLLYRQGYYAKGEAGGAK